MVKLLSCGTCAGVLIYLLCPACGLMSEETTCGSCEPESAIGGLQFRHVTCIPTHFRPNGEAEQQFCLIGRGNEVRDVRIDRVNAVI